MTAHAPDALLLVAPGCPHCPGVLQALSNLLKEGVIGRLEAVNIANHPERAEALGVRSVPFVRIGPFDLSGAQSPQALREWAGKAASGEGVSDYLQEKLNEGGLSDIEARLEADPRLLEALLPIVANPESPLQARLGAGALLESRAGSDELAALIPQLCELTSHPHSSVRSDACYYLGLSQNEAARACLEQARNDPSDEVREIVNEALETLQ